MTKSIEAAFVLGILLHSLFPSAFAEGVRIGVVAPLTGGAAASGETVRNSVSLAAAEFNSDGAVSFVFEDDQLEPKNTVTVVSKLVEINKVKGLIVFGTGTSLAVGGIVEKSEIPMIALSIVDRVVADKSFVVKHWVSSRVENELVVEEVKRRGYKRVAVVATTYDAMLALRDHFLDSKVSEIVFSEDVSKDDVDLRSLVSRVVSLRPDAVYILLWAPQAGVFAKKLRESGYSGEFFGVHNLEDQNEVSNARGALEGAWFVTGNDSAADGYYKAYREKYGKMPAAGGLNSFDAAKLMIEGVRSGDLNEFLHSTKNFSGACGIYGASGMNDFNIAATTKIVRGDSFAPVQGAR